MLGNPQSDATPSGSIDPKCKLFIRLPKNHFQNVAPDELKKAFMEVLPDDVTMVLKPEIKKGYCFLIFEERLQAAQAHDLLYQRDLMGCVIRPFFGFTKEEQVAVNAGVKDEEIERNHRTLVVRGLSEEVTETNLREFFGHYGPVHSVKIVKPRRSDGRNENPDKARKIAFIIYKKYHPALTACEQANGAEMMGSVLEVSISENKNLKKRLEKFQMQHAMGMGPWGYGPPPGVWGDGPPPGRYGGWNQGGPWGPPRGGGGWGGGSWGGRGRGSWGGRGGGRNGWGASQAGGWGNRRPKSGWGEMASKTGWGGSGGGGGWGPKSEGEKRWRPY